MKKVLAIFLGVILLTITGCSMSPEEIQTNMLLKLNNKYETTFIESDIIDVHENHGNLIYYFGKRDNLFDTTDIFATVYNKNANEITDNYSACILESDIIDRVTEATEQECYVYINTVSYPITMNKYTDLYSYIDENSGKISFNVYICSDTMIDVDKLKDNYQQEFKTSGTVNIEVLSSDMYEAIKNQDADTYSKYKNTDKLYVGTINW